MGGESSGQKKQQPTKSSSRGLGLKNSTNGGEIVEVQGGHIMRSIGRKDRHSKVCTAKGPRDRRVRLAAHTAIQFYDVQDRLGYDRPSKAVDWLIKKAKAAIDELGQLPSWHPTTTAMTGSLPNSSIIQEEDNEAARKRLEEDENQNQLEQQHGLNQADMVVSGKRAVTAMLGGEDEHQRSDRRENLNNSNGQDSSFLPPSLDSDSIADTIKSFFPMGGASTESNSSSTQFQGFPNPNLLPRTSSTSHNQDLKLSLQSFQDPILLQHNQSHQHQNHNSPPILLSGTPISFDASTLWPDQYNNNSELNRFQKLQQSWNVNSGDNTTSESGLFNSTQHLLLGHNHHHNQLLFTQRGPLQSSNTPSVRAWMDYPSSGISLSAADYNNNNNNNQQQGHYYPGGNVMPMYPSSLSGLGYQYHQPGITSFSGFHIPARIQGHEEEHDGYSDKPSSASSDSRH